MKRMFARAAAVVVAAALVFPWIGAAKTSAQSAVLMDGRTGRVLYEHNAGARQLMASTTKIMTALLICEQCSMDSPVEIRPEVTGIEGSSMYLKAGEILSVQELLYGLMLHSGNDAAMALAVYCSGSEEAFVEQMNRRARQLELQDTHYQNPHGLDGEGNYSTAYDLARLSAFALRHPLFRQTVSTRSITAGGRTLTNHNKLLWQYDGVIGVKTGYTRAAGRILVSAAERDGRQLICVTMNDPDDWRDHKALFDYGFSRYQSVSIIRQGDALGEVPVLSGTTGVVRAAAKDDFSCPMTRDETALVRLHLPRFVYAPVEAGTLAGHAVVLIDGAPAGQVELVWQNSVEKQTEKKWRSFWRRMGGRHG